MTTATDFIHRQLGAAGWAPLNCNMASFLCPEVARLHRDFSSMETSPGMLPKQFNAAIYRVQVHEYGTVLVLSRCDQFLAERMAWLGFVGVVVEGQLRTEWSRGAPAPSTNASEVDEKLDRLRALANKKLPAHECSLRRDIMAARADLERLGLEAA